MFHQLKLTIIGGLATSGILTVDTVKLVMFAIPTMILGSVVGQYVHKRIPTSVFRLMVFVLLIASGAMLIKGAADLPAALCLGVAFGALAICQLAFGKKVAAIRKADEEEKAKAAAATA